MKAFFVIFLACLALAQSKQWWENTIVYQIYPRSFKDSDGDGTGDLKGIQQKLDYLKTINVETVWLSPVFKSPMADFGYDISDFMDVDPIFGTLQDFKDLVKEAHEKGIKIVMDFVPNHSSNEHEWFIKSENNETDFRDFYIWKDPKGYDANGNPIPPNNWVSVFRFSAWTWSSKRQQFYYHAFTKEQPDLNYRNPKVVEEMKNVLRFWMDPDQVGIDGLRMDAVPFMFEDEQFLDEPISGESLNADDYNYLDHIYTFNLPEHRDMIWQFNEVLQEFELEDKQHRVVMVEALSDKLSTADLMKYYEVADFPFNFNFVVHLQNGGATASAIEEQIRDWLSNLPPGKTANWVLDNHDNPRVAFKFGQEFIDPMNMISLLLPGVAVTYNGDEIGMNNTEISWQDTVDPAGCNCGPDKYQLCSRDPERTPMQWDDSANAGFSTANKTWLPVNPNYVELNVQAQTQAQESHLKVYQELSKLRINDTRLSEGSWDTSVIGDFLGIARYLGNKALLMIFNASNQPGTANFQPNIGGVAKILIKSLNSKLQIGSEIDLSQVTLEPYEAVVIDFQGD